MLWNEIINKSNSIGTSTKNVFQEEVQKAVLVTFSQKGCFDSIVFHGGTALRLFHDNPRFSEDIDLVLREGVDRFDLSDAMRSVRRFCHEAFPFFESVEVRTQEKTEDLQRYIIRSRSGYPEQNIRLHIELASIPSYHNHPRILNYQPVQPAVRVEDLNEILADKICALALRAHLKGRDLWDIYFLSQERSIRPDWGLIGKKMEDYGERVSDMRRLLDESKKRIHERGKVILDEELKTIPSQEHT